MCRATRFAIQSGYAYFSHCTHGWLFFFRRIAILFEPPIRCDGWWWCCCFYYQTLCSFSVPLRFRSLHKYSLIWSSCDIWLCLLRIYGFGRKYGNANFHAHKHVAWSCLFLYNFFFILFLCVRQWVYLFIALYVEIVVYVWSECVRHACAWGRRMRCGQWFWVYSLCMYFVDVVVLHIHFYCYISIQKKQKMDEKMKNKKKCIFIVSMRNLCTRCGN